MYYIFKLQAIKNKRFILEDGTDFVSRNTGIKVPTCTAKRSVTYRFRQGSLLVSKNNVVPVKT